MYSIDFLINLCWLDIFGFSVEFGEWRGRISLYAILAHFDSILSVAYQFERDIEFLPVQGLTIG